MTKELKEFLLLNNYDLTILSDFEFEIIERYANDKVKDKLSQFVQRQELAVASHDNHVKIIKELEEELRSCNLHLKELLTK